MSLLDKFESDYPYIKKAVWFIEKQNGVCNTAEYDEEFKNLIQEYERDPTIELYKKLYYHYPSTLTLLRILHPEEFDNIIVDKIYDYMIDKLMNGYIPALIINQLVELLSDIINYNDQSKELYILTKDRFDENELTLKWIKVENTFDQYLILMFEKIVNKLFEYTTDCDLSDKEVKKVRSDLVKLLGNKKYVTYFYERNAYKRNAVTTLNYTQYVPKIAIFKNGYINLETNEFICSITEIFDENNQCMNIAWDDINPNDACSIDNNTKYIISMLNKMFYSKLDKSITLICGLMSNTMLTLFENLFGTYITHVSIKEYVVHGDSIRTKFVIIDAPGDISLNLIYKKLHENQYVFLNCSNNQLPRFIGNLNSDKLTVFSIDSEYFSQSTVTTFFKDIIYSDICVPEPFSVQLIKENLLCETNSAEYFCRACIVYENNTDENVVDSRTYSEQEIFKRYLAFCKNNKLTATTSTGLFSFMQTRDIIIEGDVGSRVFSGFKLV